MLPGAIYGPWTPGDLASSWALLEAALPLSHCQDSSSIVLSWGFWPERHHWCENVVNRASLESYSVLAEMLDCRLCRLSFAVCLCWTLQIQDYEHSPGAHYSQSYVLVARWGSVTDKHYVGGLLKRLKAPWAIVVCILPTIGSSCFELAESFYPPLPVTLCFSGFWIILTELFTQPVYCDRL